MQALVDNITTEQFHGNLLVIMAGYAKDVDRLFAEANEGLRSRFDKTRIEFRAWTAQQATDMTIHELEVKSDKKLTPQAKTTMLDLYSKLAQLPNWASARDVTEEVIPKMFRFRAVRLDLEAKAAARKLQDAQAAGLAPPPAPAAPAAVAAAGTAGARNKRQQAAASAEESPPYTADDVSGAFADALRNRSGGRVTAATSTSSASASSGSASWDGAAGFVYLLIFRPMVLPSD